MSRPDSRLVTFATLVGSLILAATSVGVVAAAEPSSMSPVATDETPTWPHEQAERATRLLVRFAPSVRKAERLNIGASHGLSRVDRIASRDIEVFDVPRGALGHVRRALEARKDVLSVSTDDPLYRLDGPTDEQHFRLLWGLHNTGQKILEKRGVANVDIDGVQALAVTTGDPSLVVAVIDDGVDFSHPDLIDRAWVNPGESGIVNGVDLATNGVDDDGNGIVDDVHGANFCPTIPTGKTFASGDTHGTHVAGTIAASMNGIGVVGVAPSVQIMAVKFICGKSGRTRAAIKAIEYAKSHGARISNNSWGGGRFNAELSDVIRNSGMLFVAAAGNGGLDQIGDDNDKKPVYPASYSAPNIVAVAAVNNKGKLAGFSNYGKKSVDISAPGVNIASTFPPISGCPAPCYVWSSGTSMAAPHVSGVAALAASANPSLLDNPTALKAKLLASGKTLSATAGKTVTGKIVDALYAIDVVAPTAFPPASHAFVNNTRLTTTVKVRVGWPAATDDLSGVASYAVHNSVNGGAWTKITGSTSARTLDRSLSIGSKYRYRVRATDRAGNTSAWRDGPQIVPRRYQENHKKITFSSGWKRVAVSGASGGRTRYATKSGAWAKYTFTGRALAVVAPKSSGRGSVKVYIDGVHVKTVSTQRAKTQSKVLVYTKAWAQPGTHTVKLVVVGTKGHPRFDLDALLVLK